MIEKRINIITDVLDEVAQINLLTPVEQKEVLQLIIDTLGSYPKPKEKHSGTIVTKENISAYLFVSNVRNISKLVLFGYVNLSIVAFQFIEYNLVEALSILTDKNCLTVLK